MERKKKYIAADILNGEGEIKMFKNKKGQLSLINMLWWVILVAVGAIFTPILADFANIAANNSNSTMGSIIASAIVPFFWLGIVITFFIYVVPMGLQRQ